jgi:hypothetical protein
MPTFYPAQHWRPGWRALAMLRPPSANNGSRDGNWPVVVAEANQAAAVDATHSGIGNRVLVKHRKDNGERAHNGKVRKAGPSSTSTLLS